MFSHLKMQEAGQNNKKQNVWSTAVFFLGLHFQTTCSQQASTMVKDVFLMFKVT